MINLSKEDVIDISRKIEKDGVKFLKEKYNFDKNSLVEFLNTYDLPRRKTVITKDGIVKKPWSNAELDILRKHYNYGGSKLCKKYIPDRADQDIRCKARRIGLYYRDLNRFYGKGKNKRSCVGDSKTIICKICKVEKEKSVEYFQYRKDRDQFSTICRKCMVVRGNSQRSHVRNFLQRMWYGAKRRSGDNDNVISYEEVYDLWLEQNQICKLTGVKMTTTTGKGRVPTNVSIDRICSSKGYTKDNVQLVCLWANIAKNDLPVSDFVEFCKKTATFYQ